MSGTEFTRLKQRLSEMRGGPDLVGRQTFIRFLAEVEECKREAVREAYVGQMLALMVDGEEAGQKTCRSAAEFISFFYDRKCNVAWRMMSWLATELPDAEADLALRMGREELLRGDYGQALEWLLGTLRRYPCDPSLQRVLAELPDREARDFLAFDALCEPLRGGASGARSVKAVPESGTVLTVSKAGELGQFIPQTGLFESLAGVAPGAFFVQTQGEPVMCSPTEGRLMTLSPEGALSVCRSLPSCVTEGVSDCVCIGGRTFVLDVRAGAPGVFRLEQDNAVPVRVPGLESPCAMTVFNGRLVIADAFLPHLSLYDPEGCGAEVIEGVWPHGQALALRADSLGIYLLTQEHLVRVRPGSRGTAFAMSVQALCRGKGNGSAMDLGQGNGSSCLVVGVTATPGLHVMHLDRP